MKTKKIKQAKRIPFHINIDIETGKRLDTIIAQEKPDNESWGVLIETYLIGVDYTLNGVKQQHYFWGKESVKEFTLHLEKLLSILDKRYLLTIWAFNVNYELATLFGQLFLQEYPKKEWVSDENGKFIECKIWKKDSKKELAFVFKDLWRWMQNRSLESWFTELKLPLKPSFNYEKWNVIVDEEFVHYSDKNGKSFKVLKSEELEYNKNDIIWLSNIRQAQENQVMNGLKLIGDEKIEKDLKKERKNGFLTSSSYSKWVCSWVLQKNFGENFDDLLRSIVNKDIYDLVNNSVFGGWTGHNTNSNYWKIIAGDMVSFDVNSMYPFFMEQLLPYGELLSYIPHNSTYTTWIEAKYSSISWKDSAFSFNTYPIKREATNQSIIVDEELFNEIQTHIFINDLQIIRKWYQKTDFILKNYIHLMKVAKFNATSKEERDSAKLGLNSVYGKTGERFHEYLKSYNFENRNYEKVIDQDPEFRLRTTALFIASKSRLLLFKSMRQEHKNGNIILYFDTDSIKLIKKSQKISLEIHDSDFGKWKKEYNFNEWYFGGKDKRYMAVEPNGETHIASGGISQKIIKKMKLEDLRLLFDNDWNVIIKEAGGSNGVNKYNQVVILNSDFQSNQGAKHEKEIWVK